ncbi:RNA polymerase-associated protein RapA [Methylobacterium brachiatum]|nr:RNA polymerase-associated protein RapA [Methylobacterium brachiatum]
MFTHYHSKYAARRLLLEGSGEGSLAKSLSTARVEMKPHQVDAALFALHSPLSKGVILADEVGLGKTIEASLVIAQRWAERRRRILLIVPASLRKQWSQELREKFSLRSVILEARSYREAIKAGRRPFDDPTAIILTSYEYASRRAAELATVRGTSSSSTRRTGSGMYIALPALLARSNSRNPWVVALSFF